MKHNPQINNLMLQLLEEQKEEREFLKKVGIVIKPEEEPVEPTKDNSDEVVEIENDTQNQTLNPEASPEKPE